jgi:hypothetical protein
MNNKLMVVITILAIFGLATPSFAAKLNKSMGVSYSTIEGPIVKLLPDQGALILKDSDDGKEVHLHIAESILSTLEVGQVIKVNMQGGNCVVTEVVGK